jgi:hypothetical protein
MKKRFTEEQIIGVLKEAEAGSKVAELCRKHGISEATYYNWKAKFGGMTVKSQQRLIHVLDVIFKLPPAIGTGRFSACLFKSFNQSQYGWFSCLRHSQ